MKCEECGESRETNFYPNNKSRCKNCLIKRCTAYSKANPGRVRENAARRRASPEYKEKQAKFYKKWYAENGRKRAGNYQDIILLWMGQHPEAVKVHKMVTNAINNGLLKKPLKCAICGGKGRLNGHHEDYDRPYEIIWVCSSCHKKIHLGQTNIQNNT